MERPVIMKNKEAGSRIVELNCQIVNKIELC